MKLAPLSKKTVKKDPVVGDIVTSLPDYFLRIDPYQGQKILPHYTRESIFWVNLTTARVCATFNTLFSDILVKPINNGQIFEPK